MIVRVRIQFADPGAKAEAAMRDLACGLTSDRAGVQVFADTEPGWLVAEFPMPTEAQYKAVPKIDRQIRLCVADRLDIAIGFPWSEAARARARRKAERRRSRRRTPGESG